MSRGGSNNQQIALQQQSLEEQRRANDAQLAFQSQQLAALQKTQVSPYKPMSPPPTAGTSGADYAAYQATLDQQRRYGYGDTTRGGMRRGLGGRATV